MKIALAQQNYHIANFAANTEKIIASINQAKQNQVELIVFSELCICGYPPSDFLEFDDFISKCNSSINTIAQHCIGIAAIVGAPSINNDPKGKNLFNSAFFLAEGVIKKIIHKALLPNYDVFDEYRYFEPNKNFELIEYKNFKIAITICEDLWNISDDPLYIVNPVEELKKLNPDFLINIAASPFHINQQNIRNQILSKNAIQFNLPIIYVNQIGAQTELIFDGDSKVFDNNGNTLIKLASFKEDFAIIESSDLFTLQKSKEEAVNTSNPIELIYKALVLGIRDYFSKLGFSKAILGLSGGIDSALVMVLAVDALGKDNVIPVMLPSQYSSKHSIDDSLLLIKNLGTAHHLINIEKTYHTILHELEPQFKDLPFNIAEENIQARIRGVLLMALSNKFNYILLNTTNKSEASVGYGTLYGDLCGGLSVLGDVYKTQVYKLANFINQPKEIIPQNIINKAPSAELRPNQKDSDSLPEYNMLDPILYQYIECKQGPEEIIKMGYDEKMVNRILKLVNTSEYKRYQTPPILRVSSRAFGSGRRMPIVAKYLS